MQKQEIQGYLNGILKEASRLEDGRKYGLIVGYVKTMRKLFNLPPTEHEILQNRAKQRIAVRQKKIKKLRGELRVLRNSYRLPPPLKSGGFRRVA